MFPVSFTIFCSVANFQRRAESNSIQLNSVLLQVINLSVKALDFFFPRVTIKRHRSITTRFKVPIIQNSCNAILLQISGHQGFRMASASTTSARSLFVDSRNRLAEKVQVNLNNVASIVRQVQRGSKSHEVRVQPSILKSTILRILDSRHTDNNVHSC